MNDDLYEELRELFENSGPQAAINHLCTRLRQRRDYSGLFYALLMKKRVELGVAPVPTAPAQELPEQHHAAYEDAIRQAARSVGQLCLDEGDIGQAWGFFRLINEPEPVRQAIEKYQPGPDDDYGIVIDIAFREGVHPRKGFDLILDRYGICNAISAASGVDPMQLPELREHCTRQLVRALHRELRGRLLSDINTREGTMPSTNSIPELIADRGWLFEEDCYHIDVSHLSAVVQMAMSLPPGEELNLARELCAYGTRLSPRYSYQVEPPFEDQYRDYAVYLDILAGERVEEGLDHFRRKAAAADPEEIGTYPAEVLVNLLLRLGRTDEALKTAIRYLTTAPPERQLTCPGPVELCLKTGNYAVLSEIAQRQDNPVNYLAGLIGAQPNRGAEGVSPPKEASPRNG